MGIAAMQSLLYMYTHEIRLEYTLINMTLFSRGEIYHFLILLRMIL